ALVSKVVLKASAASGWLRARPAPGPEQAFRRGVPMENDRSACVPGADQREPAWTGFARLGLGPAAMQAVGSAGYCVPTAVQERAIPVLLEGRDLIAQAPTGTGKTPAYGLPIVDQLTERDRRTQALIVVPTRELAIQVANALGQ